MSSERPTLPPIDRLRSADTGGSQKLNNENPAEWPLFPPTDESGDVDLSLVEYYLTLTPAQRLDHAQEFAEFILAAWQARGIAWSDSERF